MCGIVGFTGRRGAEPILLAGLRRLEYRGYDSAGVATIDSDSRLVVRKCAGRVAALEELLSQSPAEGECGISHTRWATHGPANDVNAHPHIGGAGLVAVAHNGVIENHAQLRDELTRLGFVFQSRTDTEVIAHLIALELKNGLDLFAAVRAILPRLEGTYGLAVVAPSEPGVLIGARMGSPLVVGLGDGEHFLASDSSAIAPHTQSVAYLQDGEVVRLTADEFNLEHLERGSIVPRVDRIDWKPDDRELGGVPHYMLKEIYEQPNTVRDACRGRIRRGEATAQFGGLNLTAAKLRRVRRIVFAACGTSLHAAKIGEYMIERAARIPVEVEYAGEFRYSNAPLDDRTLVFVLSQSGETADTLGALREARRRGHPTLAIVNTVGSTIAREADGGIYLHAGTEIGVAGTKSFTAQVVVLSLLAIYLGRLRHMSFTAGLEAIDAIESAPERLEKVLMIEPKVAAAAEKIANCKSVLFLGRDVHHPVALEGALKLKEISYVHAEGYPASEMKHGPIALIDPETPCVVVAPRGPLHAKTMSNIEEIKARRGMIVAVGTEGDRELERRADVFLPIPDVPQIIQPLLAVVPLQLLAYHVALLLGRDIDKPRNLAKSVTVE